MTAGVTKCEETHFPVEVMLLYIEKTNRCFVYKNLGFQSQLFSIYKLCCYYRLNIFCKRKVHFSACSELFNSSYSYVYLHFYVF